MKSKVSGNLNYSHSLPLSLQRSTKNENLVSTSTRITRLSIHEKRKSTPKTVLGLTNIEKGIFVICMN